MKINGSWINKLWSCVQDRSSMAFSAVSWFWEQAGKNCGPVKKTNFADSSTLYSSCIQVYFLFTFGIWYKLIYSRSWACAWNDCNTTLCLYTQIANVNKMKQTYSDSKHLSHYSEMLIPGSWGTKFKNNNPKCFKTRKF